MLSKGIIRKGQDQNEKRLEEQREMVMPLLNSLNAIRKEQERLTEQQEKFEEMLFGGN